MNVISPFVFLLSDLKVMCITLAHYPKYVKSIVIIIFDLIMSDVTIKCVVYQVEKQVISLSRTVRLW